MTDVAATWPVHLPARLREDLLAAWGSPGRGYHDLTHLAEVLERVAELLAADGDGVDREAVVLAAWFHDAVYEGRHGEDEEASARLAERELAAAGRPPELVAEVARLVRMTGDHRPAPGDRNGEVLSDADLAILAAAPERYAEYVAGVRREYAAVPDELFAAGRRYVLGELLDKPALFHTAHARAAWEGRARANASAEVAALGAG